MAHMTKVNGTAYEIVGGSTKVNGTDYDIIKGKTKVGGTDYDIEFNTTPSYYWVGWNSATWNQVYDLCRAKQNGEIDSFPADVVPGKSKYFGLYMKSDNTHGMPTTTTYYPAYIVRVDNNKGTITVLLNFSKSVRWGSSKAYGISLNGGRCMLKTFLTDLLDTSYTYWVGGFNPTTYMCRANTRYSVYATSKTAYSTLTQTNQKLFVPCARELLTSSSIETGLDSNYSSDIQQGIYDVRSLKFGFWTASQKPIGSSNCGAVYVDNPSTSTTSVVSLNTFENFCILAEIG